MKLKLKLSMHRLLALSISQILAWQKQCMSRTDSHFSSPNVAGLASMSLERRLVRVVFEREAKRKTRARSADL